MVRLAFDGSVACSPVRFHNTHESTVPNARCSSASTPPSSSSHSSLVAEKYGSSTSPVRSRTSGSTPAARSSSQRAAVRRSCHTMARCRGRPVRRSHTTTVSRWSVMPMPTTVSPSSSSAATTSPRVSCTARQISSGSCSTQPGRGKCCGSSRYAKARLTPSAPTATVRTPVVPASTARTTSVTSAPVPSAPVHSAQGVGEGAPGGVAPGSELEHVRARRGVGGEDLEQHAVAHAAQLEVGRRRCRAARRRASR